MATRLVRDRQVGVVWTQSSAERRTPAAGGPLSSAGLPPVGEFLQTERLTPSHVMAVSCLVPCVISTAHDTAPWMDILCCWPYAAFLLLLLLLAQIARQAQEHNMASCLYQPGTGYTKVVSGLAADTQQEGGSSRD